MRSSDFLVLGLLAVACGGTESPPPVAPAPACPPPPAVASAPPPVAPVAPSHGPSDAADASRAPETFDVAAIDAWVARRVVDQDLVGLSLAIVRDGKIVLAKGYGQASRENGTRVDVDTAFAVGSVTKQFTCASALLLEQDGKLSLKDRLSKYYPELPRAKDITLADLGSHVFGVPRLLPARLRRQPDAALDHTGRSHPQVRGRAARLRSRHPLVVQQHGLRHPRPRHREGERRAVRQVPDRAHS